MNRIILTFRTARQVIKADQILSKEGFIVKIIPVPENISSECGMCIETTWEFLSSLQEIMQTHQIECNLHYLPSTEQI